MPCSIVAGMMATIMTVAMAIPFMVFPVVIAEGIWIVGQPASQQRFNRSIRVPGDTWIELDPCLCQSGPGTAADPAADQRFHIPLPQKSRQRPMTTAVGIHYLLGNHLPILNLIYLKLLRMTKVLKDLPILISDRDFHNNDLPDDFDGSDAIHTALCRSFYRSSRQNKDRAHNPRLGSPNAGR